VPIGLNASSAGEYTYTLFAVIAVAMLVSWVYSSMVFSLNVLDTSA
jgi:multidrug efflux pump subunit AcrB